MVVNGKLLRIVFREVSFMGGGGGGGNDGWVFMGFPMWVNLFPMIISM